MAACTTKASKAWKLYSHNYNYSVWPMEQSSILSAKFDCPVAWQNVSLLATTHDYVTEWLIMN